MWAGDGNLGITLSGTKLMLWLWLGITEESSGLTLEKLKHFVKEKELELAKETEQLKMFHKTGWAWSEAKAKLVPGMLSMAKKTCKMGVGMFCY